VTRKGKRLRGAVTRARKRARRERRQWRAQVKALNWRRKRTTELLKSWREAPQLEKPRLLKLYRISRGLAAKSRAEAIKEGEEFREARKSRLRWEAALREYREWLKKPYPHLSGDTDSDARVLKKLESLARDIGRNIYLTSGYRSPAEQKVLWDNRENNPFPVAFCCPCQSQHCSGDAADCIIGGQAIQNVVPRAKLEQHGLTPLIGDAVHVTG
jgi:uncharacterized protein YcbK (DUF882 family)